MYRSERYKSNLETLEELTTLLVTKNGPSNLYRDAIDILPIGIAIISSRIITWCNKKILCDLGYDTLSEVVGKNSVAFYSSREEYERVGTICYPNGGIALTEMRRKDGTTINVIINVHLHSICNGRALVLFYTVDDLKSLCAAYGNCSMEVA